MKSRAIFCLLTSSSSPNSSTKVGGIAVRIQFSHHLNMPITRGAALKRNASSTSDVGIDNENNAAASSTATKKSAPKKTKQEESPSATAGTIKAVKSSNNNETTLPWYHVFTKGDQEYNDYMSKEWSYEKRGTQALFEKISLEGAQSGLSWHTILRKREAYRRTFFNFDPTKVAKMTQADVQAILDSQGDSPRDTVVRHRGKIEATINNAKCVLEMQKEAGGDEMALDRFLWSFVDDKPILHKWGKNFDPHNRDTLSECHTQTAESQAMSKALKKKGFKFVGPTTCYAMMQSVGMVIDHPMNSKEWEAARKRLESRKGGFQERTLSKE